MLDREEYERWREAAADARRGASVQSGAGLQNWACFLAEQAAQLGVKGLLHGIGGGAWGRDLVVLGARVAEAFDAELPGDLDAALRRLSRHYIPPRYPDAHPGGPPLAHYSADDARQALEDVDAVLAWAEDLWHRLLDTDDDRHGPRAGGAEDAR